MHSDLDVARGFALAAVLAADRGAERARPGLGEAPRRLSKEAERLATLTRSERDAAVQSLIALHVGQGTTTPRRAPEQESQTGPCAEQALALLVAADPRAHSEARAAASEALRAGYFADRRLLLQLESTRGAARR